MGADGNGGVRQLSSRVKNVVVKNALEDARSSLINLISTDKVIFERVKDVLDKKELADDLYIKIYDIIEELHAQDRPVQEADVLTLLDTGKEEDQSRAALIFLGRPPYESAEQKNNALLKSVKEIKNDYLTAQLESETDDGRVMQLIAEKKNLDSYLESKLLKK